MTVEGAAPRCFVVPNIGGLRVGSTLAQLSAQQAWCQSQFARRWSPGAAAAGAWKPASWVEPRLVGLTGGCRGDHGNRVHSTVGFCPSWGFAHGQLNNPRTYGGVSCHMCERAHSRPLKNARSLRPLKRSRCPSTSLGTASPIPADGYPGRGIQRSWVQASLDPLALSPSKGAANAQAGQRRRWVLFSGLLARFIHEDYVFAHNRPQDRDRRSRGFRRAAEQLAQDSPGLILSRRPEGAGRSPKGGLFVTCS
jgi:hypothetical protein